MTTAVGTNDPGAAKVRVGLAGWNYPDWRGIVYPKKKARGFDELSYLARYFDTLEINSTFYGPADPKVAEKWVKRVAHNPRFKFTAKLWKRFTHERSTAWTTDEERAAHVALTVLRDAGRLGAVLLQFPWSFKRNEASAEWLRDLLGAFSDVPLVVEVRHATWNDGEVLAELTERGVGLVNVDQPMFSNSIGPAALSTSSIGYVRLHGRNYQAWFRPNADGGERYNYLYSADELRPWVERIKEMAARPAITEVYAITNNHLLGKAPTNASMVEALLSGEKVTVPPDLYARYRTELEAFAVPDGRGQTELFNASPASP